MKTKEMTLSDKRIKRLRVQGFTQQTSKELGDLAFGIRFPFRTCVTILTIATITQSIPLFSVMLVIAFLGVVLPYHPFDYVYNYTLSGWLNKPKVPARPAKLKFACGIATTWIASVIYLLASGMSTAGTLMAVLLILVALLPSTIDYCVPSVIYDLLFKRKAGKAQTQYT